MSLDGFRPNRNQIAEAPSMERDGSHEGRRVNPRSATLPKYGSEQVDASGALEFVPCGAYRHEPDRLPIAIAGTSAGLI